MAVRAVVFDVGETLVNERRVWTAMADSLGVPPHTLFALVGAIIERREHHRTVFDLLGVPPVSGPDYDASDLYPDARPCLAQLRREGYRLGIAGNQPVRTERFLQAAALDVDFIATSGGWGVEKPSPAFFAKVLKAAGCAPAELAYVGDRVDNDVVPAANAGMVAVLLRRGPWGYLQAAWSEATRAALRLDSLLALPQRLREL